MKYLLLEMSIRLTRPSRPSFRKVLLGLGIVCGLGCALVACRTRTANRVNLIVITLDTVRRDHLTVYGYYRNTSPALLALSRESVVLDRVYTPLPMTFPAHFSLMTAQPPAVHGVLYNGEKCADSKIVFLAERMREAGYQTAGFLGSGIFRPDGGLKRGFQDFFSNLWRKRPPDRKTNLNNYVRGADEVVKLARDYLLARDRGRPFFIWLHFWDAHGPYYSPPGYIDRFSDDPTLAQTMQQRNQAPTFQFLDKTWPTAAAINEYDGGIRFIDDELGGFIAFLKDQGLYDSTLILIVSDHGEGLNEHGTYVHGLNTHEEAVRIPALIRFPRGEFGGRRLETLATIMDLAPTVLEALRLPPLPAVAGQSLMPILRGEAPAASRALMLESSSKPEDSSLEVPRTFGLVDGNWKYMIDSQGQERLYDLAADPFELADVSATHAPELKKLRAALISFQKKYPALPAQPPLSPEVVRQLKALGY